MEKNWSYWSLIDVDIYWNYPWHNRKNSYTFITNVYFWLIYNITHKQLMTNQKQNSYCHQQYTILKVRNLQKTANSFLKDQILEEKANYNERFICLNHRLMHICLNKTTTVQFVLRQYCIQINFFMYTCYTIHK